MNEYDRCSVFVHVHCVLLYSQNFLPRKDVRYCWKLDHEKFRFVFEQNLPNHEIFTTWNFYDVATDINVTNPYPPLENVYLAGVSPTGLLFSWNQTQNCPSLRYNISSENCGQCPNTTDSTSVNCSDFTILNSINLCTFAVQTIICGNSGAPLVGNFSDSVTVNLTGK